MEGLGAGLQVNSEVTSVPAFRAPIETERLIPRHLEMDDVEDIHRIMDLDLHVQPPEYRLTLAERRERTTYHVMQSRLDPGFDYRAVILKSDGRFIRRCGLSSYLAHFIQIESGRYLDDPYMSLEVELGYDLDSAHRGKGYATEVARAMIDHGFSELRLNRIITITGDDNARSIAVMKKAGMKIMPNVHPDWTGEVVGILENDRF